MLIFDLFNAVLDQSDHESMNILRMLNKRRTAYATKYSLLGYYDASVDFNDIFITDKIKTIKRIVAILMVNDESRCVVIGNSMGDVCANDKRRKGTPRHFINHMLSCCAGIGHLATVKFLIEMGASVNILSVVTDNRTLDKTHDHLFNNCVRLGHFDIVKYLMSFSMLITVDNVVCACMRTNQLTILKYYVTHCCNFQQDFMAKYKYVFDDMVVDCAKYCDLKMLEYLKSIGANIKNNEAMMQSVFHHRLDSFRFFVENGADVHTNNDYLLRQCASRGFLKYTKYLVSIGSNVNASDGPCSVVINAALNGHLTVMEYLISVGAIIDNVKWLINTCESRGHRDVVFYLRSFVL